MNNRLEVECEVGLGGLFSGCLLQGVVKGGALGRACLSEVGSKEELTRLYS